MGWAKYAEDNIEIMTERQFLFENRKQEINLRIVCSNAIPLKNIVFEAARKEYENAEIQPPEFEDKYIVCRDCGRKVFFSAQAQKHYAARGWDNPKRCKNCRDFRNARYLMCTSF